MYQEYRSCLSQTHHLLEEERARTVRGGGSRPLAQIEEELEFIRDRITMSVLAEFPPDPTAKAHLAVCDAEGYCKFCGFQ